MVSWNGCHEGTNVVKKRGLGETESGEVNQANSDDEC